MAMRWRTKVARWLCRLASWIQPDAEIRIRVVQQEPAVVRVELPPPMGARPTRRYTGRGSGTRHDIVDILKTMGPLTRKEIDALLDVTTSGQHLPRMVEDGVLVVQRVPSEVPHPWGNLKVNRYHLAQDQREATA